MQEEGDETIRVLTVLGKQYLIDERSAATLQDLKNQLLRLTGIDPQNQLLIIKGALCKDPAAPLSIYGSNPVCILAQKTEADVDAPAPVEQAGWPEDSHSHGHDRHPSCMQAERFLTREEEAAYRQEVEGSYSAGLVRELRSIMPEVSEELAVRALRACCNDLSEAIDFVELEKRGENFQEFELEGRPPHQPVYEQSFLRAYVEQQQLGGKLSRSRDGYTLFVASMKEKSPVTYDMLVRNRLFMEKLLFDRPRPLPPPSYRPASLRASISREERAAWVGRLASFGLPQEDAVWRLREAGNNLLLAEERIVEGKPECSGRQAIELLPLGCREHLLKAFLQSPAWQPLKARLQGMAAREAHALVLRRLRKHLPAILALANNALWAIYPYLLSVPYSSIELVRFASNWPAVRLRRRSQAEAERQHRLYSDLVDREIVETLVSMGVPPSLAERATRASFNLADHACMLVLLGRVPAKHEAWLVCEENEVKAVDYYVRNLFCYELYDVGEFELQVAALAETNETAYQAFLKYEGIYEAYRHLASNYPRPCSLAQDRRNMKTLLRKIGDIRSFHEYGTKAKMIAYSSFK